MDTQSVIQLLTILFLLLLSAFFSSAETALTSANKVKIGGLAKENNRRAILLEKILQNYGKMLSTILIGNNIVNITASALVTTLTIRIWGDVAIGIATGILTIVILLFGEIIPKHLASFYADRVALAYSPVIYALITLLTPVIYLVNSLSHGIMFLLRIDTSKKVSAMTEHELKTYVDVSHEDGIIETEEREMIYNVFDFRDALAKDIMIPRINMTTVCADATYQELLAVFKDSMYTRIPVYENDTDHIIGIVNVKDLLLVESKDEFQIKNILRDAYYTYEFKKSADLLLEMRELAANVTLVLNEYGATVGMITLEDLLEEIVGEIRDEYDEDEKEFIQAISEREYLVEGGMKLSDLNDALDLELLSDDYDSIGGIIIELLDSLPEDGASVTTENGTLLKVEGINQNRIEKVRIILPEPFTFNNEQNSSSEQ